MSINLQAVEEFLEQVLAEIGEISLEIERYVEQLLAAHEFARGFFKLSTTPNDRPKTSLDELDQVERHLNKRAAFLDWLGIRVYEPERVNDKVIWHLRRNPSDKLTNILTIGVYEGHAFVIKNISKLANTYACVH